LGATEEGSLNTLAIEVGIVTTKEPFRKIDPEKVVKYVKEAKK